ncbi:MULTISPECIES: hypothetical protein [Sporolactobacillus]|uniref:Transposase IS701-like DDE domain-containing protein n=2 Tax=Sporolactobacillus TaxID=2077 RepID=A0A917W3K3_9BACL|nr:MULTISPECIES: hypothetical protein [Sporolactobacillus]GEB76763.1 hypothetical protein SIN01_11080 [Sporolactobacillus inulinus]GGL59771.1 hypothetical protein GCM10007968_24680 [Sporolactobacillus putidus]
MFRIQTSDQSLADSSRSNSCHGGTDVKGVHAPYVLMDSWFTQQLLVKALTCQGLDVISIVKATNQRYQVDRNSLD